MKNGTLHYTRAKKKAAKCIWVVHMETTTITLLKYIKTLKVHANSYLTTNKTHKKNGKEK